MKNKSLFVPVKFLLVFSTILLVSLSSIAQTQKAGKTCPKDDEKIKAEKVAFITEKMSLTVKEAQEFWPLYNEFTAKMDDLFKEEHKITRELRKDYETLSESILEQKLDRLVQIKIDRAELEGLYHTKYKTTLDANKIALLYNAERQFRKHLLQKYKDHPCAKE